MKPELVGIACLVGSAAACSGTRSPEEVVRSFDAAWARNDLDGVVALFADDATLESPLVPRLLHRSDGVLHGKEEIREMVRTLLQRGTPWSGHDPPLVRGNTVALEFRGPAAEGATFFSVDILETKDGKIQSLRAYSGFRALRRGPSSTPADRPTSSGAQVAQGRARPCKDAWVLTEDECVLIEDECVLIEDACVLRRTSGS